MVAPEKIRRVLFCSGKVYWDLYEERARLGVKDIAIVRVEQLAPFPFDKVMNELKRYPNAQVTWCQEEPKNMGPWTHLYFFFRTCLRTLGSVRLLSFQPSPYFLAT